MYPGELRSIVAIGSCELAWLIGDIIYLMLISPSDTGGAHMHDDWIVLCFIIAVILVFIVLAVGCSSSSSIEICKGVFYGTVL